MPTAVPAFFCQIPVGIPMRPVNSSGSGKSFRPTVALVHARILAPKYPGVYAGGQRIGRLTARQLPPAATTFTLAQPCGEARPETIGLLPDWKRDGVCMPSFAPSRFL
jgi:hypothetical protein